MEVNANGSEAKRTNLRIAALRRFERISSVEELADALFPKLGPS
jgi:hypothetical protein